jgi:hypothetical protein
LGHRRGISPILLRVSSAHAKNPARLTESRCNCAQRHEKKRYDRVARRPGLLEARPPYVC